MVGPPPSPKGFSEFSLSPAAVERFVWSAAWQQRTARQPSGPPGLRVGHWATPLPSRTALHGPAALATPPGAARAPRGGRLRAPAVGAALHPSHADPQRPCRPGLSPPQFSTKCVFVGSFLFSLKRMQKCKTKQNHFPRCSIQGCRCFVPLAPHLSKFPCSLIVVLGWAVVCRLAAHPASSWHTTPNVSSRLFTRRASLSGIT